MTEIGSASAFRDGQRLAWTYHRATARWSFNVEVADSPPLLPAREDPCAPWTELPVGRVPPIPVGDAIAHRLSCRTFGREPVALSDLGALLRGAYGLLGSSRNGDTTYVERPAPSAGGLYPLEVSILVRAVEGIDAGVYHFVPAAQGLELGRSVELPSPFVTYLFMGQHWVADAALVIVLSAVTDRSLSKYHDRGYRYLLIEAGHVMQNVNLVACALGLGAVNVGGFFDDELAGLIGADPEYEIPLYACAVGVPAMPLDGNRITIRALPE